MAENVITSKFYLCKRKVNLIKVAAMKMGICFIQFHTKYLIIQLKPGVRSTVKSPRIPTEKFLKSIKKILRTNQMEIVSK